jgi:pilus assembly protein CpaB
MALAINKNWALLAAAIALGGAAFYLSNKVVQDRMAQLDADAKRGKKNTTVVVAVRDMAVGDIIDETSVATRDVPEEFVSNSAVRPDQFNSISEQALLVPVKRGEPILVSFTASQGGSVFSGTLKKGSRALTFEVDEVNSVSGMLRPGDRIDLILTTKAGAKNAAGNEVEYTLPMLSNVEVLATGQVSKQLKTGDKAGETRSFSTITLELTPQDANRIIVAKGSSGGSRLTAVLRNPQDKMPNPSNATSLQDVVASLGMGDYKAMNLKTVEYLVGGGGRSGSPSSVDVLKDLQALQKSPTLKAPEAAAPPQITNLPQASVTPQNIAPPATGTTPYTK